MCVVMCQVSAFPFINFSRRASASTVRSFLSALSGAEGRREAEMSFRDQDGPGWTRMDQDGPGWTTMGCHPLLGIFASRHHVHPLVKRMSSPERS